MATLTVNDITKKFKKKVALDDVSCSFSNGITALLGPNGAGKSTLMNIMCTLLSADSGTVSYKGKNICELDEEYLGKIAIQFQNQPMYKNYMAEEYLEFCGALKGIDKRKIAEQSEELLKFFGLEADKKKKIATFSGGMKQRLALCGTFLGNPEIVMLDEPSAGLDIYEREELKNLLCELKKNCIIIVSTHIVSDIENIADRIVLLNEGKIQSTGTQQELIENIQEKVWELPNDFADGDLYHTYRSNGKLLCISEEKPHAEAKAKQADMTDVYFSCITTR